MGRASRNIIVFAFILNSFGFVVAQPLQKNKNDTPKLISEAATAPWLPDTLFLPSLVDTIFEAFEVQKPPSFPGGMDSLHLYLIKNLKYPQEAIDREIEGVVKVKFLVTKEGKLRNIQVLHGGIPILNEEAIRVVMKMPFWNPGVYQDKKVAVWMVLPIRFQLNY